MPIIRDWDASRPYYGPPSGRGIGNTNPGLEARPPQTRHPDGSYLPAGRGIVNLPVRPVKNIDRRDNRGGRSLGVPVGSPVLIGNTKQFPRPSIPQVRKWDWPSPQKVPAEIVGPIQFPNPPFFPGTTTTVPKLNPRILNPPVIPTRVQQGPVDVLIDLIKPNIPTKVQPVALDLGNLLQTGLTGYIDYKKAGQVPVYDWSGLNPWSNVPLDQAPGAPGLGTVIPTSGGSCLPPGYKYDKCGNVVKTRRRRRRRLATSSDIKDLAALSSVTTGPEKKTWIATHPS